MARGSGKVLFVAPSAYRLGGVQFWLNYITVGLESNGWSVSTGLVSGTTHDVEKYQVSYPGLPRVSKISNPTGSREGRVRALTCAIVQSGCGLVVSANIADSFAAVRRLRAQGRELWLAISLHAIQSDLLDDIRRESDWLDAVVVTNRMTEKMVCDMGFEKQRVLYAPYGIEASAMKLEVLKNASAGILPRKNRDKLVIGYCGRIEESQKRFSDVLAVVESLAKREALGAFWVAGGGAADESVREQLVAMLGQRLRWLGSVASNELPERFYAHIDALLITSSWETGPIVAWEAMACGVPVVTSNYVGANEEGALVDRENCLMFPIGDVPGAVVAIEALRDDALRKKIVAGGCTLVESRYTEAASVAAWDQALQQVLALPLRPVELSVARGDASPQGRLDRCLGVSRAETVRRAFGVKFVHKDPGGEWPHSYGRSDTDENLALARVAVDGPGRATR